MSDNSYPVTTFKVSCFGRLAMAPLLAKVIDSYLVSFEASGEGSYTCKKNFKILF